MKKIIFALFISVLLLLAACSKNKETELIVKNNTSAKVWVRVNNSENRDTILSNTSKTYSWLLKSGGLTGAEEKSVKLDYNGYTVFQNDTTLTLSAGDIIAYNINADGGCIKIINDSEDFTIMEVYISPSDSLYWGDNLLDNKTIAPQDSVSWTCSPDIWDIKVVDDFGDSFTSMNNRIEIDQIYRYVYTGFKRKNIQTDKKAGRLHIKGLERN